jgi:uncharacterized SAM-binding protein YcdF (DUF218 family)
VKNSETNKILKHLVSVLKGFLFVMGSIALVMIILALTSAPFWIWYNLGVKKAGIHRPPDFVVVMGGGGMPSESGLMRCWYASKVASHYSRARVIIALPGDAKDSLSSVNLMKKELELRGISAERIMIEDSGTNTRAEAVNVFNIISEIEQFQNSNRQSSIVNRQSAILIVTSPEHLYRSVLTFKKAGFMKVDGVPAFEKTIEADLDFSAQKLGARGWVPDVGSNMTIRYQFWMHMDYEFLVLREWLALTYYKLQGWI